MDKDALNMLRQLYVKDAKHLIERAAISVKFAYDKRHKPIDFKPGDKVYLYLHKGYYILRKPP
jgi:hypothetical protein